MVFLSGLAAVVIMMGGTASMSDDMTLLYGDLESDAAAVIVSKLEAEGMKAELRKEGREVYVKSDLVYVLRAQLAMEGIVPGSIEKLDKKEVAL